MEITAKIFQEGQDFGDGWVVNFGALQFPDRVPLTLQGPSHIVIGYAENFHRTGDGSIMADITVTTDDIIDSDRLVSWIDTAIGFKKPKTAHVTYAKLREIKALK